MTFEELGLSPWLLEAIKERGYGAPTTIQEQTVPSALSGRDVLGIAQTGTGKTGAFCFPVLERLAKGRLRARMPRALVLVPTRELALQVEESVKTYGRNKSFPTALLVGGSSLGEQAKILSQGADILVATPGRLLDHLQRGRILTGDIRILVIDEADRMMDMGFIDDLESIVKRLPVQRQTLLFSATMPEPIKQLANKFLTDPVFVQVNPSSPSAESVTQWSLHLSSRRKKEVLTKIINSETFENMIIFCNRKREIPKLLAHLREHLAHKELRLGVLHGDLSQEERNTSIRDFKSGTLDILIASDVASRGLDVAGMSHVINFDVPINADEYIHRIGRTGRAGRSGVAITLVTEEDAKAFKAIVDLIRKDIPIYSSVDFPAPEKGQEEDVALPPRAGPRPERTGRGRTQERRRPAVERNQRDQRDQREHQEHRDSQERRPHTAEALSEAPAGFGTSIPKFMR